MNVALMSEIDPLYSERHSTASALARSLALIILGFGLSAQVDRAQANPQVRSDSSVRQIRAESAQAMATRPVLFTCPGRFPTDLTMFNCEYTQHQRVQQWVTNSLTDQAILGAVVYGMGAQIIRSPSEWPRTWLGLGDRIGVRYTQAIARGSAEFLVGSLLRDDPRHLSYKDDPHTHYRENANLSSPTKTAFKRIGHAFQDSVTVRRSNPYGSGRRIPALDRLVGVSAGAYGGYPWYPQEQNSFANVSKRAASSYGSTLLGSFYTEFSPEISLGLSRLFASRKKAQ